MNRMTALVFGVACCVLYPPALVRAQGAPASPARGPVGKAAKPNAVQEFKVSFEVATVACSPDGKLIAVANGGPTLILQTDGTSRAADNWLPAAQVIERATGKVAVTLKLSSDEEDAILASTPRASHFEVTALAFTPDGSQIAVGTNIGQVKLFDARSGKLVRAFDDVKEKLADRETSESWKSLPRAMGAVSCVAFSPEGERIATSGDSFADFSRVFNARGRLGERTTGARRVKVWDVKTGAVRHDLVAHSHARAVAFSPDGNRLATAGAWRTEDEAGAGVILWDGQKEVGRFKIDERGGVVRSVAFSPDGKQLAVCAPGFTGEDSKDDPKGVVAVADVASATVTWARKTSGLAKPVAILPNDSSVITLCNGAMWFRDLKTGEIQSIINPGDEHGKGGRWNDLATAKRGHMQVMAGVNADRKGTVFVLDPDREGDEPPPKPGL